MYVCMYVCMCCDDLLCLLCFRKYQGHQAESVHLGWGLAYLYKTSWPLSFGLSLSSRTLILCLFVLFGIKLCIEVDLINYFGFGLP